MRNRWIFATTAVAMLAIGSSAQAQTDVWGNSTPDRIYVGRVDVPFPVDNTSNHIVAACIDDQTGGGGDRWVVMETSGTLTGSWLIHGDTSAGSTSDDYLEVIFNSGDNPPGFCGTGTGGTAASTWDPPNYGTSWLDLHGGLGDDILWDGGGTHITFLYGEGGDDSVNQISTGGQANGNLGADVVYGMTSGNSDQLFGGLGNDCLWDSTNSWSIFNCGGQAGDVADISNPTGTTGCNGGLQVCCGLC